MRAGFRWAAIALAVLALLLLAVHAPPVQRYVFDTTRQSLARQGVVLDARSFSFNLLTGTAGLEGGSVASAAAPGLPAFASFNSARLDFSTWSLISGSPAIHRLEVDGLRIHFQTEANGADNLPRLVGPPGEPSSGTFRIDSVKATASLEYIDRRRAITARVPAATIEADSLTATAIGALRLRTGPNASVTAAGRQYPIDSLSLNASAAGDAVRISDFQIQSAASKASSSGTLSTQRIDAAVQLTLDPALLPPPVEGALNASLRITGSPAQPRIEITSATIDSPTAHLEARGNVSASATSLTAEFRSLDVAHYAALFKPPLTPFATAAGTLTVQFRGLDWKSATAHLAASLSPAPGPLPLSGALTADISPAGYRITAAPLRAAAAEISGAIAVSPAGSLQGNATLSAPDLAAASRAAARITRSSIPAIQGSGRAEITIAGTLAQPVLNASVGIQQGDFKLEAQVDSTGPSAQVSSSTLTYRGRPVARASGSLTPLDLTAEADKVPLADLLRMAAIQAPIDGSAAGTFHLTRDSGSGHLILTGLTAYQESLGTLDADLRLNQSELAIDNAILRKPAGGEFRGRGTYRLDDASVRFTGQGSDLVIEGFNLPQGTARGKINLTVDAESAGATHRLDATVSAAGAKWNETDIGRLQATANLLGDGLTATIQLPDYNATSHIRLGLESPYPAVIDAKLEQTGLRRLPLDPPLDGSITATLSATGNLERWQDADAKGEIAALRAGRGDAILTSAAPARFSFARRTLTLEPLTLTTGQSRVTLEGQIPAAEATAPADLHLAGNLTSDDASTLLAAFGHEPPEDLAGSAQWDLRLRGPWRQFSPEGSLKLTGQYAGFTAIDAAASVTPQSVEFTSLRALWNQAPIEASGTIPLAVIAPEGWLSAPRATAPGRLHLAWKNLDLGPLLSSSNDKLGGASSGEADLTVKGLTPRDIGGQVTLNPLDIKFGELALALEQPATLTLTNGVARIDQLNLKGSAGTLAFKGEAGLLKPQPIRLQAAGKFDTSLLAAFTDQIVASGDAGLELLITGTSTAPAFAGFVATEGADAALPAYNLQAEGIKARIDFEGDNVTLTSFNASVNGGTLVGAGNFRLVKGTPEDVHLNFTAANVYLEYPRDLKTAVSSALALRSSQGQYNLNGDVQILDGSYAENINFDQFLLRGLTNPATTAEDDETTLAKTLRFNIGLRTVDPIVINNNLGKVAANADLKLLGTSANPGLSGRITLEEGGELRLNERSYSIERGVITFTDERRIKPAADLLAHTQVGGHEITLQVQGEPGAFDSKLTSDPSLPESDIIALLVTGRTLDRLSGNEADVTKEQVLSYLASRVGGELTRTVERTFGLSQVRIQPNLIAAESDPSARLTVGQDIARQVHLTYSMDLGRSNDQLWLGEWDATRRFHLRGFKDFDNTYRFEFRHELQFGASDPNLKAQPRAPVRKLGNINFNGAFYVTPQELAARAKLRSGKRYDFFAIRKASTRLEDFYHSRNFHEARIRTEREVHDSTVDLLFRVREGSAVTFVYEGWMPSASVKKQILRAWQQGVFDTGRIIASMALLRGSLLADGYLQPAVTHRIREAEGKKQVLFEIQRGAKYDHPVIAIEGASGLPPARVKRAVNAHRPQTDVFLRPQRVAETVQRLYRSEGFLEAAIAAPRLETNSQSHTARLILAVKEGRRFTVHSVQFSGNSALAEADLRTAAALTSGEAYHPDHIAAATQNLLSAYAAKGYNDAEIEPSVHRGDGTVELEFKITEHRRALLDEIRVTGNHRTSAGLVRNQSRLREGDIVNAQKFSEARRSLYSTGAFSLIEIETEELPGPEKEKHLRATINVRELTPFSLKYGAFYDTERGPGAIFDFVTRNYLRSARAAGIRGRYDSQVHEVRAYFSQPLLRSFPIGTTATVFVRRELHETFIADHTGVSVVQESRFKKHYILNYGYRLEKTHTYDRVPDEFFPFDITLRVAPLQMTLTRENRDDILDATRGSFLSQSLEYAPKGLGSELRFMRYYGQYFHYLALTPPSEIPWSNGARRPRVIYAAALRLGLAKGLDGQDLVLSERFFAGGGASVRGFERDRVGPLDSRGDPRGGNSLFVMNHELRFPVASLFDGVGFFDAGNVFPTASALRPWDLRTAAGLGVRLRTPYLLFRLDYGMNLHRRPGEPIGQWYFSIGQTF